MSQLAWHDSQSAVPPTSAAGEAGGQPLSAAVNTGILGTFSSVARGFLVDMQHQAAWMRVVS